MFLAAPRADGMGDRSPWGQFWFSPIGAMTRSGVSVTAANALGLPTALACVQVLAKSFASMPFALYKPKFSGGKTRITNHWLYRLMAKAPNRFQTPFEWKMMLMGHLALRGNAFCQITANSQGEILELLPLHPDRMSIEVLDDAGNYRYKYIAQSGQTIYYKRGEVWHLRWLSDDGYMGLSPIQIAREALAEGISIQSYSSRFFANDARPGGGWIEFPGGFANKEAKKVFRESWQDMQGGVNRGKVAVLEKGMKYHEIGLNNKESQFIEARAEKRKEIAAIFGVPPHKVGILDDATFSNIEQQAIEFWTDCMLPWAEMWESSMEFFLLGADEPLGLEPEFDMSRMLRGDSVARSAYYTSGINAGWLVRNEAREMEGLDPIDGLDEPLRPLNMVEESDADDEIAEGDDGADDKAKPGDMSGADARRARRREKRAAAKHAMHKAAEARVNGMLQAAAERLARRVAKADGKMPEAGVVAEIMAVPLASAQQWLDANAGATLTESELIASLVALGKSV